MLYNVYVDRGVDMKRFLFLVLGLLLFVTACGNKLSTYHEISYDEYKEMISNKDTFPLVIGSSSCSACSLFKPTMESFISKYQIDVRYIDIAKLSDEEKDEFSSITGFKSTPTTIFFENGEQASVYYRIVGSESFDNVVKAFTRMGYIGE